MWKMQLMEVREILNRDYLPNKCHASGASCQLVAQNVLLHDGTVLAKDRVQLVVGDGARQIGHIQVGVLDGLSARTSIGDLFR